MHGVRLVELARNAPGGDARARHSLRKSGNLRRRARALGQSKFSSFIFLRVHPQSLRSRRHRRRCLVPPPSLAAAVPRDVVRPSHGSARFQRRGGDADTDATATKWKLKNRIRARACTPQRVDSFESRHVPLESTRRTSSRVQASLSGPPTERWVRFSIGTKMYTDIDVYW